MFWYSPEKFKFQKVCEGVGCKQRFTTKREGERYCKECQIRLKIVGKDARVIQ